MGDVSWQPSEGCLQRVTVIDIWKRSKIRAINVLHLSLSQIMKCGSVLLWKDGFIRQYSSKFYLKMYLN